MSAIVDLDAYLARIGYDGQRTADLATLSALVLAHQSAIPFESLDPVLGRRVAIDPASLQAKLVAGGRGGYCFENNGLFLLALRALGFEVTPLAARVVWGAPPDARLGPLTHMLLKVDLPEGPFLVDVGFGGQSPTAPLHLEDGLEQITPHGAYRLIANGRGHELQMALPGGWAGLYRFEETPQGQADYEMFNWFSCTHPQARFTSWLVASRVMGPGRVSLINLERTLFMPDAAPERTMLADAEALRRTLKDDFGVEADLADLGPLFDRLAALPETA